jgi:nucleotide-binding universal stress UspA family protein
MVKSILVCMNAGARAQPHVEPALNAAKALGATAVGLCIIAVQPIPAYAEAPLAVDVFEHELHRRRADAQALERRFADAARKAEVTSEWCGVEGDWLDIAAAHGRTTDLVALAQDNPDEWVGPGETEELVLTLGRPVLAVPYVGAGSVVGGRAIVAWSGARESARAVHDAMPLLMRASSVVVAGVDLGPAAQSSMERLRAQLARYGIKAEVRGLSGVGMDEGAVLLNAVSDEGANLLVMGAYGHSRMRELILGGATRTVFRQMTAPVLLSH